MIRPGGDVRPYFKHVMNHPFFAVEGADGVGKTSLIEALTRELSNLKIPTVLVKDPGTTDFGNHLRSFLQRSDRKPLCFEAELLTFQAIKHQLVEEIILPSLSAGRVVISDRFGLSTCVYQCYLRGMSIARFLPLYTATQAFEPSCYIVLRAKPETVKQRLHKRYGEGELPSFYESGDNLALLHEGFQRPEIWTSQDVLVVDTDDKTPEEIAANIVPILVDRYALRKYLRLAPQEQDPDGGGS